MTAAEDEPREKAAGTFLRVEHIFYVAVAVALAGAGAGLFVYALWSFFTHLPTTSFSKNVLELIDGMLLVFIVTELIHTVSAVIAEKVLMTEPFLIVGIVAAIRRMIFISAEAKDLMGTPQFSDAMLELGVLVGATLALGFTIFLLRHTSHSEPRPAHEPAG